MRSSRRKSGALKGTTPPSNKKQRRSVRFDVSVTDDNANDVSCNLSSAEEISATVLARKLAEAGENLAKAKIDSVDLVGYDLKQGENETAEEFMRRHEEVKQLLGNPESFDDDTKVGLDLDDAAVGGAIALVDSTRTTRSISHKLVSYCGLDEDKFLYSGLDENHSDAKASQDLIKSRQASVIESFVDFKKQIRFKMTVLNHVAEKISGSSHSKSYPRAVKARVTVNQFKTPAQKALINPLDSRQIVDRYALEVASRVAGRSRKRKIAGIPFNLNILDDDWSEA